MPVSLDDVREARARAATQHAALLGNASACTRAKSGESFPAGKFWEGQTAALSELMRARPDDVSAEAGRLLQVWAERPIPGRPAEVEAYRAGGLEALGEFAAPARG